VFAPPPARPDQGAAPGQARSLSDSENGGGDAVAFKNPDGSLVAIAYNSAAAKSDFVVAIGGKKVQFAMPGNGWATVKVTP
jgi:O-glycosyl hydrolase